MASVFAIQKVFLTSPCFAVIGASRAQSKYGTKVLQWYKQRGMNVQPIHHRETELEGLKTIPSVAELRNPSQTAISIITPPEVTLSILQSALPLGVRAVWCQPGAADESVAAWVKENGEEGRVIYGRPCILRDGDGLRSRLGL